MIRHSLPYFRLQCSDCGAIFYKRNKHWKYCNSCSFLAAVHHWKKRRKLQQATMNAMHAFWLKCSQSERATILESLRMKRVASDIKKSLDALQQFFNETSHIPLDEKFGSRMQAAIAKLNKKSPMPVYKL